MLFNMKKLPLLSVIIPTLNRKELLIQALSAIMDTQKYPRYEIIVVDQSGTYDRESVMERLKIRLSDEIVLQYCIVDFKGLPRARNHGLARAHGEIILFLDDDIEPYPDLFIEHIKPYEKFYSIGGIAGRVIEKPDLFTNTSKIGGFVSFTGRSFRNYNVDKCGFTKSSLGANMSFRKSVMDKIGLFDERFIGTGELEETDYCYRVRKAGHEIFYNNKAAVKHLISPIGGCRADFEQRQYYKMYNLGLFFSKHKFFLFLPFLCLFQAATIIKRVVSCNVFHKPILCLRLFQGLVKGYLQGRSAIRKGWL